MMDGEPARLADALDRGLDEALALLRFLTEHLPELVQTRRRAIEAIWRDVSSAPVDRRLR